MGIAQHPAALRVVRFEVQAPADARRVALVGDFNAWNKFSHAMRRGPSGTWQILLDLAPGRYQYKFLANGSQWLIDSNAREQAMNQYGTSNSIIEVR